MVVTVMNVTVLNLVGVIINRIKTHYGVIKVKFKLEEFLKSHRKHCATLSKRIGEWWSE